MKPRHLFPAILLTVLVLGYPLSVGPVVRWVYGRRLPAPTWVARVYIPLTAACRWMPPVDRAMNWYLELWLGKSPVGDWKLQ